MKTWCLDGYQRRVWVSLKQSGSEHICQTYTAHFPDMPFSVLVVVSCHILHSKLPRFLMHNKYELKLCSDVKITAIARNRFRDRSLKKRIKHRFLAMLIYLVEDTSMLCSTFH